MMMSHRRPAVCAQNSTKKTDMQQKATGRDRTCAAALKEMSLSRSLPAECLHFRTIGIFLHLESGVPASLDFGWAVIDLILKF